MNKKNIIITAVIVLVIIIAIVFIFNNIKKDNKKNVKDNNDLVFVFKNKENIEHEITFDYDNNKIKDIILTIYFDSDSEAKSMMSLYKEQKEYKNYKVDGKKVILYYKDKDIKDYSNVNKTDIITEFTQRGYEYKK